eukprot:95917-Alexandrium_andersonii.AAC.1
MDCNSRASLFINAVQEEVRARAPQGREGGIGGRPCQARPCLARPGHQRRLRGPSGTRARTKCRMQTKWRVYIAPAARTKRRLQAKRRYTSLPQRSYAN